MNLDQQITDFLTRADSRPTQSKLEPYAELIRGLRQRRWTYRRIAGALKVQFGVSAMPSTIHDFVRVRAGRLQAAPVPASREPEPTAPSATPRKRRFHLEM